MVSASPARTARSTPKWRLQSRGKTLAHIRSLREPGVGRPANIRSETVAVRFPGRWFRPPGAPVAPGGNARGETLGCEARPPYPGISRHGCSRTPTATATQRRCDAKKSGNGF